MSGNGESGKPSSEGWKTAPSIYDGAFMFEASLNRDILVHRADFVQPDRVGDIASPEGKVGQV